MEENKPVNPTNQKSNFIVVLLSSLLIIYCIIAGFFAWQVQRLNEELKTVHDKLEQKSDVDWRVYTNNDKNITFKYPSDWMIDEINSQESKLILNFYFGQTAIEENKICTIEWGDGDTRTLDYLKSEYYPDGIYSTVGGKPALIVSNDSLAIVKYDELTSIEFRGDFGVIIPTFQFTNSEVTGCTMEAKICPDGTTVGRSGPNCEFAKCP